MNQTQVEKKPSFYARIFFITHRIFILSKLAEKYSFQKLYLELHHLLSFSMYYLDSMYEKYYTELSGSFSKIFLDISNKPNF